MRTLRRFASATFLLLSIAGTASASSVAGLPASVSSGPLPWERVLGVVVSSLTGNTAKGLALVAFAICGIGFLFSEGGSGMRKLLGIGIGISLIVGAGSLVSMFFAGGSGLGI
jgi:type IV secretion system protein VirB2